jgi:hypothetical protein
MNDTEAHPTGKPVRRPPWNKGKLIGAKPPLRAWHQAPNRGWERKNRCRSGLVGRSQRR